MLSLTQPASCQFNLSYLAQSLKTLLHTLTSVHARSSRALPILCAVFAMNIADLYFTLTYATSIGMGELNPLARLLMQHATVPAIILFKLLTVTLGCGLLYFTRRSRLSELAAWIAFCGLLLLTIRWIQYADVMHAITGSTQFLAANQPSDWVEIQSR